MAEKISEIKVSELVRPARTIGKDTVVSEALKMIGKECSDMLSVVDEDGKLIGAVSEANFMKLAKHEPSSLIGDPIWFDSVSPDAGKQLIGSIMTANVTTISPDESIDTALKVMNANNYRLLHVVGQDGKLLGTVRIKDMFGRLLEG